MSNWNEKVKFKLIQTPCCKHLICWINPRLPNFCPECGENIMATVRSAVVFIDDDAWLKMSKGGDAKVRLK